MWSRDAAQQAHLRSTLGTIVNGQPIGDYFATDDVLMRAGENEVIAGGVHSPFVFSVFIPWCCPEFRDARGTLDRILGPSLVRSATAQRTASTMLANSTKSPSPVVLTMRPRYSAIFGSDTWRRSAVTAPRVPSSPPRSAANSRDIGRQDRHQPPLDLPGIHGVDATAISPSTIVCAWCSTARWRRPY
jgi:hypothetical protein